MNIINTIYLFIMSSLLFIQPGISNVNKIPDTEKSIVISTTTDTASVTSSIRNTNTELSPMKIEHEAVSPTIKPVETNNNLATTSAPTTIVVLKTTVSSGYSSGSSQTSSGSSIPAAITSMPDIDNTASSTSISQNVATTTNNVATSTSETSESNNATSTATTTDTTYELRAFDDSLGCIKNETVKFLVSKLTIRSKELTKKNVTLSSVSPASEKGGTVLIDGPWVIFTPPIDYVGLDSFTFTVKDSDGNSATAKDTVTISNREPTPYVSREILPNGNYLLKFVGIPNFAYSMSISSDKETWTPEVGVTTNDLGQIYFEDTTGTTTEHFYMLR